MTLVFVTGLNIVVGLVLEGWAARAGLPFIETLVGLVTISHLAYYIFRPPVIRGEPIDRRTLLICLMLATFGEMVLTAGLGLYRYRQSVLPLFVPPGHVLLFLSGLVISKQNWFCRRFAIALLLTSAALVLYNFLVHHDALSLPLFFAFIGFCIWGTERKLYAAMFMLALLLEILGTSVGAWRWEPTAFSIFDFKVTSANPPLAAGAFYACLDLLTFHAQRSFLKLGTHR